MNQIQLNEHKMVDIKNYKVALNTDIKKLEELRKKFGNILAPDKK